MVRHCAPTLAGLKTGNLFNYPFGNRGEVTEQIRQLNRQLVPRGLRIVTMKFSKNKVLLYLYRPARLKNDLSRTEAKELLNGLGYACKNTEQCVICLIERLRESTEFPHEIGLFLSYPPEDVKGFMENRDCDCKCVGCWKVYGDEEHAQKLFRQYKRCTDCYLQQWEKGRAVEKLIVAV